jgi:hypothetical protein
VRLCRRVGPSPIDLSLVWTAWGLGVPTKEEGLLGLMGVWASLKLGYQSWGWAGSPAARVFKLEQRLRVGPGLVLKALVVPSEGGGDSTDPVSGQS